MARKILGTNKFVVYMYNGKSVRGGTAKSKHFVGRQWGRVWEIDENGKMLGNGKAFTDYGEMITFINKILVKSLRKNLKAQGNL